MCDGTLVALVINTLFKHLVVIFYYALVIARFLIIPKKTQEAQSDSVAYVQIFIITHVNH